jgi:hypothetical protein
MRAHAPAELAHLKFDGYGPLQVASGPTGLPAQSPMHGATSQESLLRSLSHESEAGEVNGPAVFASSKAFIARIRDIGEGVGRARRADRRPAD